MKKRVSIDELIRVARYERETAERYWSEGKTDSGIRTDTRVSAMITLITAACCSSDHAKWDNEWEQVYNAIMYGTEMR